MPRTRSLQQSVFASVLAIILLTGIGFPAKTAQAAELCVGNGCPYTTIQDAINAASAGDTITVHSGVYNENITIDKALTLKSDAGASNTTIAGDGGATIRITASNVTIEGFAITNHNGYNAIVATDVSHIAIRNNVIVDITAATTPGYVHAIAIVANNAAVDDILIENNTFQDISSLGTTADSSSSTGQRGYSASAINIGWTSHNDTLINGTIIIRNNLIKNIQSNTGNWKSGHGAYGILVSHSTSNVQILNNVITDLQGLWARGIAIEGNGSNALQQTNAVIKLNTISNVSSPNAQSATAINFEANDATCTSTLKRNRLLNTPVGITNQTDNPIDARYNYWENIGTPFITTGGNVDISSPCSDRGCFPRVASTTPGAGAVLATGPTQIAVTFTENVSQASAEDTSNYLLVESGPNGATDTTSCAAGLAGDDTRIPVNTATYSGANPFTATIRVNGGIPLPAGRYRLLVCGTTSINNDFDVELNDGAIDTTIDFTVQIPASSLPKTGFPKGRVTFLPPQPETKAYTSTGLTLNIPKFGVSMPIVGVPRTGNSWDVSWLGNRAGYLEGSAFPTWAGNTVLTGHVWNADNTPGPFLHLRDLHYGDHIEIHAWGQVYTYEIRENSTLFPWQINRAFQHETYDWLTLLTCEGYNPFTNDYIFRRAVRAVLVDVRPEANTISAAR